MHITAMVFAGAMGIAIAAIHGYLGDRKVIAALRGGPETAFRVARAVMFLSAVYWFVAGAALVAAPLVLTPDAARIAAAIAAAMYLSGAAANAWATRGRHFGAPLLAGAGVLAAIGAA